MEPIYTILYVADVPKSAAFYRELFGKEPVEDHPTFAMFLLENGSAWGLWTRTDVLPAADVPGGGAEYLLAVESREALDSLAAAWKARGITVIQEPTDLDFGYTFTALDPDGHRLRPTVFAAHTAGAKS